MQSYLYNDDPSYCDDERYDEEADCLHFATDNGHQIVGNVFNYPSYDEDEDMM